jgi:hypothetical protein
MQDYLYIVMIIKYFSVYIFLYDNRFIFLTEIKNVGKPETDIDV